MVNWIERINEHEFSNKQKATKEFDAISVKFIKSKKLKFDFGLDRCE